MEAIKLEYGEISVDKICRNLFIAKSKTTEPFKSDIEMKGKTAEIAKQKLELFLQNKPYKHLDHA